MLFYCYFLYFCIEFQISQHFTKQLLIINDKHNSPDI